MLDGVQNGDIKMAMNFKTLEQTRYEQTSLCRIERIQKKCINKKIYGFKLIVTLHENRKEPYAPAYTRTRLTTLESVGYSLIENLGFLLTVDRAGNFRL